MTLREFLLHHTNVGEIVIIREGGWQTGCTMIDHEDLFINSLAQSYLNMEVLEHERVKKEWTTKTVVEVECRYNYENRESE